MWTRESTPYVSSEANRKLLEYDLFTTKDQQEELPTDKYKTGQPINAWDGNYSAGLDQRFIEAGDACLKSVLDQAVFLTGTRKSEPEQQIAVFDAVRNFSDMVCFSLMPRESIPLEKGSQPVGY